MVVGEHGTSEVLLWSSASVGGVPVLELLGQGGQPVDALMREIEDDIRYITIIEGTGERVGRHRQHGPLVAQHRLGQARRHRPDAVLARYGVTLSLVSVLGAGGIQQMHEPAMTSDERAALERSAGAVREAARRVLAVKP
jgi:L-lactate dehydrogenase